MDSSVCIAETSAVFIQVFNSCLIVELMFSVVLEALNFETEIALESGKIFGFHLGLSTMNSGLLTL